MGRLLGTAAVGAVALATAVAGIAPAAARIGEPAPRPPVITPSQAGAVLTQMGVVTTKANATLNPKLLATIETGPALAVDTQFYAGNKKAGVPFPVSQTTDTTLFVPRQTSWPAYLVAFDAATDANGNGSTQVSLVQQLSKGAPWKTVLYANGPDGADPPDVILDSDGFATVATVKDAAVPPLQLSRALCTHLSAAGGTADLFVLGDDGGASEFVQQAVGSAQTTAVSQGHKFTNRCVARPRPVVAFQTSEGAFAIFSASFVTTETGTKTNPVVVAPPASGKATALPAGKYLSTRFVNIAMLGANVQNPSAGSSTPIDAAFGQVFGGPATGVTSSK